MLIQGHLMKIIPSSNRADTALRLRLSVLSSIFYNRYHNIGNDLIDWFIEADVRGVNAYLYK